jgi:hypothetical protein
MGDMRPQALDFSGDERKHRTRVRTYEIVKQCPRLWQDGKLRVDWIELSGVKDPMLTLIRPALDPRRFVGISRETQVVEANGVHFRDLVGAGLAVYVQAELEDEIADLGGYPHAGVLVFDGFTTVANGDIEQALAQLLNFARHKATVHGQALLVTNFVVRANRAASDHVENIERYKECLERLLGQKPSEEHFEKYRSEGRKYWMLLHRILISEPGLPVPDGVTVWYL